MVSVRSINEKETSLEVSFFCIFLRNRFRYRSRKKGVYNMPKEFAAEVVTEFERLKRVFGEKGYTNLNPNAAYIQSETGYILHESAFTAVKCDTSNEVYVVTLAVDNGEGCILILHHGLHTNFLNSYETQSGHKIILADELPTAYRQSDWLMFVIPTHRESMQAIIPSDND